MSAHRVAVRPGDDAGPEVVAEALKALDAMGMAPEAMLAAGERTRDLGGTATTAAFEDAVAATLRAG